MTFVYIVQAWVGSDRIPVASFADRSAAEHCVKNTLLGHLKSMGLSPTTCDYYTVEQWALGGILDRESVRTLTSFSRTGDVDRVLVDYGHEGEGVYEPQRLRAIFEEGDLLLASEEDAP